MWPGLKMSDEAEASGCRKARAASADEPSGSWVTFGEYKDEDVKSFPEPPLPSTLNQEYYLSSLGELVVVDGLTSHQIEYAALQLIIRTETKIRK